MLPVRLESHKTVTFAQPLINREIKQTRSPTVYCSIPAPNHQLDITSLAVCRICYSGENSGPKDGEPLISPCSCKGTMGLYHSTCLKKWLLSSNTSSCEICRFRYELKRRRRTLYEYLTDEEAVMEQKTLWTDLLCFLVLTPLVFLSTVICITLAVDFLYNYRREGFTEPKFGLGSGLIFLSFILLLAYCAWLIVTLIFHHKTYLNWQRLHPDFVVIDQLSQEESILINGSFSNGKKSFLRKLLGAFSR